MRLTAILDIDGTLVDTNYQHALAWFRALGEYGCVLPIWRIHRTIGMGGDQLVPALAGDDFEREHGDDVRAAEGERYSELIGEVQPLPSARALIERLKEDGHAVVLASSAKAEEVDHYLDLLDARELADGWTSSADVEATKPQPDLVQVALSRAAQPDRRSGEHRRSPSRPGPADEAVMLGDSTFDCEAAGRAGVRSIGVLTGGFSEDELLEAGAAAIFESPEDLLGHIDETPFAVTSSA